MATSVIPYRLSDYSPAISNLKGDIAIVQDGDTATRTIAKGSYVVWKGTLQTAKQAIGSGTTLSTTNLQAVSDGGLNALNDNLSTLRGGVGTDITSDTFIMGLMPGTYNVNAPATAVTNGYIPERWGVLTINKSGENYNSCTFISTSNKTYFRSYNSSNSTWYGSWQEVALKSELASIATFKSFSVDASATAIFTLGNGGRYRISTFGNANSLITESLAYTSGSGTHRFMAVLTNSSIAVSLDNNKIKVVNSNSGSPATVIFDIYAGSVTQNS